MRATLFSVVCLAVAWSIPALAQRQPVGEKIVIDPDTLPAPYATKSTANPPRRMSVPSNPTLAMPPGFAFNRFADGFLHARNLIVAPNGDVLLAESQAGRITILRDTKGQGVADVRSIFAEGLDVPHGLALHGGYLYVGELHQVRRLPYRVGDLKAAGKPEDVTAKDALGALSAGHWTRNIAFSADGRGLFVTVGSRHNRAEEPLPYASVQWFDMNGQNQRTFANGLRNPVGIAVNPVSGVPYVVVNERDGLGDGLVPDYLVGLHDGGFYGWPYAYAGRHPDPDYGSMKPDLVAKALAGDVLFQSHSAPLGLIFYDGAMFPAEYKGDAFVSFHGSWNSSKPTGYLIARVRFKDGRPAGHGYETFATGFWGEGDDTAHVWGRPVGLAVAKDGALLIADDVANAIWRISYRSR
ncbi:MAG TPA: PQQ-dependent sugar dehydrogenase [Candidatus Cybelea sp.]|nr:PQQ-dependent sugar dehydrogenase [Candidatus Cybelea sp.]